MLTKTSPVKIKAGEDDGLAAGEFEALVSVFGNVDSDGDRVVKGAFEKSLAEWGERGDPIPVIWTHDHTDPFAHIGEVSDAKETDDGLLIKGTLDIDDEADNRTARQVYRLLKRRRVTNWSYAYDEVETAPTDDANELRELKLHEVGPTLVGSNRETDLLSIKRRKDDDDKGETVSDKPWSDFTNADYSDDQYARACVLDRGPDAGTAKQRYSLPVREPDGTLNRGGVHAAASALGGARTELDATDEQKAAAARKLRGLYSTLGEDPPEGLGKTDDGVEAELVGPAGELNALLDAHPPLVQLLRGWLARDDGKASDVLAKTGRVLSAKNEGDLRKAADLINGVLSQLGKPDDPKNTQDDRKNEDPTGKFDDDGLAMQLHLAKLKGASL